MLQYTFSICTDPYDTEPAIKFLDAVDAYLETHNGSSAKFYAVEDGPVYACIETEKSINAADPLSRFCGPFLLSDGIFLVKKKPLSVTNEVNINEYRNELTRNAGI